MRITIVAVGRARKSLEQITYEHYAKRIRWPLKLVEVPNNASKLSALGNKKNLLARAIPDGAIVIVLDERGENLSSLELAERIQNWRDSGFLEFVFVIGGAEGLTADVRNLGKLVLSFGRVTWPHLLVRTLLAEQIYRAQQILARHPYHRV